MQKADKGNIIVIFGNDFYFKCVEELLTEPEKFKNIPAAPDKDRNYVINCDKINQNLSALFKNLCLSNTRT